MNVHNNNKTANQIFNWVAVFFLIYSMLVAVSTVSDGFKIFSGGAAGAEQIFQFVTNPFIALILGT